MVFKRGCSCVDLLGFPLLIRCEFEGLGASVVNEVGTLPFVLWLKGFLRHNCILFVFQNNSLRVLDCQTLLNFCHLLEVIADHHDEVV